MNLRDIKSHWDEAKRKAYIEDHWGYFERQWAVFEQREAARKEAEGNTREYRRACAAYDAYMREARQAFDKLGAYHRLQLKREYPKLYAKLV